MLKGISLPVLSQMRYKHNRHPHSPLVQQNSFNLATDNPALLIVWLLRNRVQWLEVLLSVTSGTHIVAVNLTCVIWALLSSSRYYNGFKGSQGE